MTAPTNKQLKKRMAKVEAKRKARHESDLKRQEERTRAKYEHRLNRMFREKTVPIRRDPMDHEASRVARDAEIRTQLEHNMQILQALEGEMEREEASRRATNEQLERGGATTLEEKMQALQGQVGVGGGADTAFTPGGDGV